MSRRADDPAPDARVREFVRRGAALSGSGGGSLWAQPVSPESFRSPLDVILSAHARQHAISGWLLEQVDGRRLQPVQAESRALLTFLTRDLPLHHQDEEEDLFPLLRSRCRPDDGIDAILAELDRDHAAESFLVRDIAVDLRAIAGGKPPESAARLLASLRLFAEGQRRHLHWENQVVVPLTEKRLTAKDLEALGRKMAARREIDYPS